jgi:oxygen-independent coproporphyrinogen-3 oxidase
MILKLFIHEKRKYMEQINFEQLSKFSKAGPRYTSYPTAIEFKDTPEVKTAYLEELKNSQAPLSIYLHLPFCRSACYFCGCNVVYTSKVDKRIRYIEYLKKELEIFKKFVDINRLVTQLHFGGGTPTFFTAEELDEIIHAIKNTFPNFSDDAEISCEIDPRFLNREQMKILADNGFNRISFGVQDFDIEVQNAVHRVQPFDIVKQSVDLSREFGVKSVNIDLIYGLPFQTLESFKNTLELSLKLNPDRFAIFNYAHVPWLMKTMRKIDETTLPKPSEKLKILKYSIDFLTSHNYKMIGMDHFAKPDDELFLAIEKGELHRNFQGYTTKGGTQLLGIGLTSIGYGENYYIQNFKDMKSYEKTIDNGELPIFRGVKLDEDDKIRKAVIMELMSNFKLNIKRLEQQFNIDFKTYFADEVLELKPFLEDEIVQIFDDKIQVSFTGTMMIRNIAMVFDKYMHQHKNAKKIFSKTI